MKERLTTLLTALVALALVIFLFAPHSQNSEKPVSLPTSEDRGADGLKGLYAWLQREGLAVASFRKRYTDLHKDKTLPEHGNVLIASMPAPREVRETEWSALSDWLDKGNTLIILGAVYQHPRWMTADDCFCDVKKFLSGYDWTLTTEDLENHDESTAFEKEAAKTLQGTLNALQSGLNDVLPHDSELLPESSHPLLRNVTTLHTRTRTNLTKEAWTLSGEGSDNFALRLLQLKDTDITAAWWMNAGAGRIVLLLSPDVFSNSRLGQADNARFINNLLAQSLAPDGRLLFDDYHFGLSELYDPEHFFNDERLHKTLACLGLFWLLYVAGYTTRLAPVRKVDATLSMQDFITVTTEFFARRLTKPLLAEALVKHLLADILKRRKMRNEAEIWRWLEQHSQVTADQIHLLRQALSKRRLSLLRLSNTITYIRTVTL